jgi:hypothetical protein
MRQYPGHIFPNSFRQILAGSKGYAVPIDDPDMQMVYEKTVREVADDYGLDPDGSTSDLASH